MTRTPFQVLNVQIADESGQNTIDHTDRSARSSVSDSKRNASFRPRSHSGRACRRWRVSWLIPQFCRPVLDHHHPEIALSAAFGFHHQKALPVAGGLEPGEHSRRDAEERLGLPTFDARLSRLHLRRHERATGGQPIEFPAVAAPSWVIPAGLRDLPLAPQLRIPLDVDLIASRLI